MHSMAGLEQSECEADSSKPHPPPAVINVKGTKYSVGELRWSLRAVAALAWERLLSDVPCSLPLVSAVAESLGMVATEDSSVDL